MLMSASTFSWQVSMGASGNASGTAPPGFGRTRVERFRFNIDSHRFGKGTVSILQR
jgi:hypothetical protein